MVPDPKPCSAVRDRASAFLDGSLTPPVRRAVQQHLHDCEPCLREYRALVELARRSARRPRRSVRLDLAHRVRERVRHDRRGRTAALDDGLGPLPRQGWGRQFAVAAVLLAIGGVLGLTAGLALGTGVGPMQLQPGTTGQQGPAPMVRIDDGAAEAEASGVEVPRSPDAERESEGNDVPDGTAPIAR